LLAHLVRKLLIQSTLGIAFDFARLDACEEAVEGGSSVE
jgi:hypothetical protein